MSRTELLVKNIQDTCKYTFKNPAMLKEAFTHDSNRVNDRTVATYQRLEFLGDSVLSLVISEYLYRKHPDYKEGQLTDARKKLIEAKKQMEIAEKLNVKDFIEFGQSVQKDVFSKYHSFVESLIGAIYMDGGFTEAERVVRHLWGLEPKSSANNAWGCVLA
jgi:ribonuclease III